MATNYYNAQIGVVDTSGNVNVIYPITKSTNVDVTSATYGGSSNTTVLQTALNNLTAALNNKQSKLSLEKIEFQFNYANFPSSGDFDAPTGQESWAHERDTINFRVGRLGLKSTSNHNLGNYPLLYNDITPREINYVSNASTQGSFLPIMISSGQPYVPGSSIATVSHIIPSNFIYTPQANVNTSTTWYMECYVTAGITSWPDSVKNGSTFRYYAFILKP